MTCFFWCSDTLCCSIDPIHIDDPLFPTNNVGRNCFRIHQCTKVSCMWYSLCLPLSIRTMICMTIEVNNFLVQLCDNVTLSSRQVMLQWYIISSFLRFLCKFCYYYYYYYYSYNYCYYIFSVLHNSWK